jgi:hypothetical protein
MSGDLEELGRIIGQLETLYAGKHVDRYARLLELDEALTAKGFPGMSDWWKDVLARFYSSKRRWLVLRVGRRGGKSSTLCRMAVVEVLYGDYPIPPGDVGYWAFISTSREEASARLVTIKAILDAIRVKYRPVENGVIVEGRNVGFKTYVATIAGVSGFTAIGFTADELAKWKDKDTGANPANEVLKSLKPAMATVPNSRGILSSSPFSTLDAHAEAFDAGDSENQMCAHAPTWVANPTITEAMTRELEEDESTRLREYGAVPVSSGTQYFYDHAAIDRAAKPWEMPLRAEFGMVVSGGADFGFVSDSAAMAINQRMGDWNKARCRIADLDEVSPGPGVPLKPGPVVQRFAAQLKMHCLDAVMADHHYKMSIVEHLDEHGLGFIDAPSDVAQPFIRSRVLLNGERLDLPGGTLGTKLVKQMKQTMWRPTPNGALSIILPRKPGAGHCDLLSASVLAIWQPNGYEVPRDEAALSEADKMLEQDLDRWRQDKEDREHGKDWLQRRMR